MREYSAAQKRQSRLVSQAVMDKERARVMTPLGAIPEGSPKG